MAWWIKPKEVAGADGTGTGRWRLTATSDEDGGGPFGDVSHDHGSPQEAEACEACDEYTSQITGFLSKAKLARLKEQAAHVELDRLAERFLTWPLPESVCSDLCATMRGHPGRTGTSLLSFIEAREMLRHVLGSEGKPPEVP